MRMSHGERTQSNESRCENYKTHDKTISISLLDNGNREPKLLKKLGNNYSLNRSWAYVLPFLNPTINLLKVYINLWNGEKLLLPRYDKPQPGLLRSGSGSMLFGLKEGLMKIFGFYKWILMHIYNKIFQLFPETATAQSNQKFFSTEMSIPGLFSNACDPLTRYKYVEDNYKNRTRKQNKDC